MPNCTCCERVEVKEAEGAGLLPERTCQTEKNERTLLFVRERKRTSGSCQIALDVNVSM